jgi:glycosyltransferase involved in cell wall biosynthesis
MDKSSIPLVSVFSLVYNHENFIRRAIDSWLMQKTSFKFEIVIGEDCSTDKSREIVLSYAKKYPDIIKVITSDTNVGMRENSRRTKNACTGKYIAFCEGDDYWIDPNKLQIQVEFMEKNPDFSLCFHDAILLWDEKTWPPKYFVPLNQKEVSTTEDVIENYFIPTASMLVRAEYIKRLPEWFEKIYNGDWATQLILSTQGKIKYIDELMSVYRKNIGGLSGSIGKDVEFVNGKKIELLNYFNQYSENKYADLINQKIATLEKDIKINKLKKNNKFLFWLSNPKKSLLKISHHLLSE